MMTLTIKDVPPSPNELRRTYRTAHAYKRLRETWEWALVSAVGPHHRELLRHQAKREKHIEVQITIYHVGTYDHDNLAGAQKPVLDALVNIGFLAGDSPGKLHLLAPAQFKCSKKDCKTVVKIGVAE